MIGQDIGGYRIIEQIGVGGMAKVYKAYQPAFDRFVALKVLPDHYAEDETYLERFTQEAKIIANLEHHHILPVHDFGEDGGITYLAMRYLRAGTLKDVLSKSGGWLPPGDVARIISQIAGALDHAHSQGIVHRDVKPSNILIDPHGDAYLTDFGIAKVLEGTSHLTKTGSAIGTPAYMSPEQGAGRSVDARSDVYSLGVMLYQMLTGRVPFEADTPLAVLLAHEREPLPLPSSINPDIPDEVERVIFKALAKNPDDRFQTAGSLALAFEQVLGAWEAAQVGASDALLAASAALAEGKPSDEVTRDVRVAARRKPRGEQSISPIVGLAGLAVIAVLIGIFALLLRGTISVPAAQPTIDLTQAVAFMADATGTRRAEIRTEVPITQTHRAALGTGTPGGQFAPATAVPTLEPLDPDGYLERAVASGLETEGADFAVAALEAAQGRPPDYQEDFSDPTSGHPQVEASTGYVRYEDGVYAIASTLDLPDGRPGVSVEGPFTDVVAQVDLSIDSYEGATPQWGQFFLRVGAEGHYGFELHWSANAVEYQFGMWDYPAQEYTQFYSGTLPPGADTRLAAWHSLIGVAVDDHLAYFVDGILVASVVNDAYPAGDFSTGTGPGTLTRLDNIRIWDLSGS